MNAFRVLIGKICAFLASLGPIGHLPAPGTCGTFAAIFILYGARVIGARYGLSNLVITVLALVIAYVLIKGALIVFRQKDPQQIVIDEVAGYFVAMYMFSFNLITIALTFILFRLFDIEKPWGIASLENLPGAWGIIADDVAAGVMTMFVVSWVIYGLELFGIGSCFL